MTDHDTTPLTPRQLERLTVLGRCLQLHVGDEGALGVNDAIVAAEWVLDEESLLTAADGGKDLRPAGGGTGGTIHVHYDGPPPPAPPTTAAEFLAQAIRGGSPINTVRPGSVFGKQP